MKETVHINSGEIVLEGRLTRQSPTQAAIVAHPHPLYGGNMHSNVVVNAAEVYQEMGWTTLRFNFRGVGASQGAYDDGQGEQADLQAAIDFLASRGMRQIDLAGYSFGAWVISHWICQNESPNNKKIDHRILLISPPVAFLDFDEIGPIQGLLGVITGDQDEIAPPDMIKIRLPRWSSQAEMVVLDNTDHFYVGRLDDLKKGLRRILT